MSQSHQKLNTKRDMFSYDALQDKNASYYFSGYGVKKHLKKLRKIIQEQPRQKGFREYEEVLDKKLADLQKQQLRNNPIEPYQQTLKLSSLQKLKNFQHAFHVQKLKAIKTDEPKTNHNKGNSLSNFPSISKTIEPIVYREPQANLQRSLEIKQERPFTVQKSMSYAGKPNILAPKMPQRGNRDRNNSSIDPKKLNFPTRQMGMTQSKELKHEQFISFLKTQKESAQNMKKIIRQQQAKKEIREQILQYTID